MVSCVLVWNFVVIVVVLIFFFSSVPSKTTRKIEFVDAYTVRAKQVYRLELERQILK